MTLNTVEVTGSRGKQVTGFFDIVSKIFMVTTARLRNLTFSGY